MWNTRPVSAAELERVEQQVRTEAESPQLQRELERCVAKPRQYGVGGSADVRTACEDMMLPQVEWYTNRPAARPRLRSAGSPGSRSWSC